MDGVSFFDVIWLSVVSAGALMTGIGLPGVWLVAVGGAVLEVAADGAPDWRTVAVYFGLAAACQVLPHFLPRRWRGSPYGNRLIGFGTTPGALLLGLPGLLLKTPWLATVVAVGALAGGYVIEYRRRHERLANGDDDEEDGTRTSLRPGSLLLRIAVIAFRTALAVSLALWIVRHVLTAGPPA